MDTDAAALPAPGGQRAATGNPMSGGFLCWWLLSLVSRSFRGESRLGRVELEPNTPSLLARHEYIDEDSTMISLARGGGRSHLEALALALGVWVFCDSSAVAQDSGCVVPGKGRKDEEGTKGPHVHSRSGSGTLGYGASRSVPGLSRLWSRVPSRLWLRWRRPGRRRRRRLSLLRWPRLSPLRAASPTDWGNHSFSLLRRPGLSFPRPPQLLRRLRPAGPRPAGRHGRHRSWRADRGHRLWRLYRRCSESRSTLRPVHGPRRGRCIVHEDEIVLFHRYPHQPLSGGRTRPTTTLHNSGRGREPQLARCTSLSGDRIGAGRRCRAACGG